MQKFTLAALGAAALFALPGTAASAADTTPVCSKTVTDNCMQREGHAAAPRHAAAKHHGVPKHRVAARHRTAKTHRVAAAAPKRPAPAKTTPAPARKM